MDITNDREMSKVMRAEMDRVMYQVLEDTKTYLKDYVQYWIYDKYTPIVYERTYELIDSISFEIKKAGRINWSGRVFFDTSQIHEYERDNQWTAHEDGGEAFIADIEENGRLTKDPETSGKPLKSIENTKLYLDWGGIEKMLREAAIRSPLNVIIE